MVTNNAGNIPTGASGTVLQGQGVGTAPAFSTPTYPSASGSAGKILISDGTNNIYSTPTYPNTSGSAGKILVSDGTNNVYSTPTFPNASATARKIIVSDGTNWVASTETYAVPGSSGNLMTSDGTNWTSAAPGGTGGSLVLLSHNTPSSASSLALTSQISATYSVYLLVCTLTNESHGGTYSIDYSTNNGSTYLGSGMFNGATYNAHNAATWTNTTSAATGILTGSLGGTTNSQWTIWIVTSGTCSATGQVLWSNGSVSLVSQVNHDVATSSVNAIRLNINGASTAFTGTVNFYGLRNS